MDLRALGRWRGIIEGAEAVRDRKKVLQSFHGNNTVCGRMGGEVNDWFLVKFALRKSVQCKFGCLPNRYCKNGG